MRARFCELCGADAALRCAADAAFLCFTCDAIVHSDNFLFARHIRHLLCSSCRSPAAAAFSGYFIALAPRRVLCRLCSGERPLPAEESDSDCVSSESDCVSSIGPGADSPAKIRPPCGERKLDADTISSSSSLTDVSGRFPSGEVISATARRSSSTAAVSRRIDPRAEGILGIWRRRLGLSDDSAVVKLASRALSSSAEMTALPLRVQLAASFWIGLWMSEGGSQNKNAAATWQSLIKRLEYVSGVPAKLIVAASAKMVRASRLRRIPSHVDLKEGCGECSP